ncbi:MAG TPA: PQQ-binding-like beta-propeller repeat protein [Actinotalea sp.]
MGLLRGPARAAEAVDVELVDVADADAPARPAAGRPTDRPRRRHRRRNRVALVVAALVLIGFATLADVRQSVLDTLLAGLGRGGVVLLPLDGPLTEHWRTEATEVTGTMGSLVLLRDANGTRAVDSRTGEVQWERPPAARGATEVCRPLAEEAGQVFPPVDPQRLVSPERDVTDVICLSGTPLGERLADEQGSDGTSRTTITVLDGGSGEPTRTERVTGALVASHVHDGDLLLVTAADDATLRLTRWNPVTGDIQWRREVVPADARGLRFADWQRGVLTIASHAGTLAYSLDSGHQLQVTKPLPPQVVAVDRRLLPRSGLEVVWGSYRVPGPGDVFPGGAGAVVHADNSEVPIPGPPLEVGVDDGSVPSLVLVATSPTSVGAVDVETGALRWEAEHSATAQVSVLEKGIAVLVDGTVATALDVRTGTALWTVTGLAEHPGSLGLTDGKRVLLRHTQGGQELLAAHDLRTGAVAWTASLPAGTDGLISSGDGRVLALGAGWVAGLG